MNNKIVVRSVYKKYEGLKVLAGINFECKKGEFIAVIGPSGCGKTTLLNILAGLIKKDVGRISVFNHSPEELKEQRKTSIIFQDLNLLPWRTIKRNVDLPNEIANKEKSSDDLIESVGLKDFRNYYPDQLSIGMQQRVALARALVSNPEMLLLDEPFGSLDELTRETMQLELLRLWAKNRFSAIFVTHNIYEAVFLADKVLVMSEKPAVIIKSLDINLPRPRNFKISTNNQFNLYVKQLRNVLKNSGSKDIKRGCL